MSVYIKDMEMPKRGHTVTITIVGSGESYVEYYDCKPHIEETIEYKAVPVPEHGRLGDFDELKKVVKGNNWSNPTVPTAVNAIIARMPTIIPADKEGE